MPLRLPRALLLVACFLGAAAISAGADNVIETSRDGSRVSLTLRSGPHPQIGDYPVTVYLPPGYDTETASYPVLYIFDGNDIHAEHDLLVAQNLIQPALLVSIANKTSTSRQFDLTPSVSGPNSGGLESFADLIVFQLKPYLDSHFRTRPEAASTGIVGNSYGGLAACWLGYFRPDIFGLAACLEPSLWWNNNQLLDRLTSDTTPKSATRFWIMGADEDIPSQWQNAKIAAQALTLRGWREGDDVAFCQVHNYPHGWAGAQPQLRSMLHFLLRRARPELIGLELTNCHGPQLVPLRPVQLGGVAYADLDLLFRHDLRTTAIAPVLQIADPQVISLGISVLGQLFPTGPGWTTVAADFEGFHAVVDVQGLGGDAAAPPPERPAPPRIAEHPASRTVAPGGSVEFSVAATGAGPFSYQWRRDNQLLPGATGASLAFDHLAAADAGDYSVIVSNPAGGSTVSRFARLAVATPDPGRLVNLSVRGPAGIGGQPLIIGFVVSGGGAKRLLVRGVGPELASRFSVGGALSDPRLAVHASVNQQDRVVAANDDWSAVPADRDALAAVFGSVGAFALSAPSRDAALLLEVDGVRTVHASGPPSAASGVVLVEAYDAGEGNTPRLVNLSARNRVGVGDDVLIAGFVINGNVPKRLLVRGVGPALVSQGVTAPLAEPRLELHATIAGEDTVLAANEHWGDEGAAALRAAFTTCGAFDLPDAASKDSALLLTLPAGIYSAVVSGVGGATGEALVEIYELP